MSQVIKQVATVKIKVIPGSATPGGSISASLGQKGVNIKSFCDKFNEITKHLKGTVVSPVNVKVKCFSDKTFEIEYHNNVNTSTLIQETLGIVKEKKKTNTKNTNTSVKRLSITKKQVEEIVAKKRKDLFAINDEQATKLVEGTLRSMAIDIIG